ncbi:MAG: hypothetical protein ABW019_07710 [Chitinophagaceae bacterium]
MSSVFTTCSRLLAGLLLFFVAVYSLSCNNTEDVPGAGMPAEINEEPSNDSILFVADIDTAVTVRDTSAQLTSSGSNVKVVIHRIEGYGQDEAFARETASLLERIINSAEFRTRVLATNFEYHNNGLTNREIYNAMIRAHEADGPGGADGVIDLRLRIITEQQDGRRWIRACNRRTIGIDGGGSGVAAVCPDWLRSTALEKHYSWLAAHFIHEYMHVLGFRHPDHKLQSVPYLIHDIIEEIAETL